MPSTGDVDFDGEFIGVVTSQLREKRYSRYTRMRRGIFSLTFFVSAVLGTWIYEFIN